MLPVYCLEFLSAVVARASDILYLLLLHVAIVILNLPRWMQN